MGMWVMTSAQEMTAGSVSELAKASAPALVN
jgi:hypothetical protein